MKNDETAVSPVIGVILMVAITVVLATVVFVLVSELSKTREAPPQITFGKNETSLTVIQAPLGLDWADFTVTGCDTVPTGPVAGGQEITDCAGNVTVVHVPSNALVYETTF